VLGTKSNKSESLSTWKRPSGQDAQLYVHDYVEVASSMSCWSVQGVRVLHSTPFNWVRICFVLLSFAAAALFANFPGNFVECWPAAFSHLCSCLLVGFPNQPNPSFIFRSPLQLFSNKSCQLIYCGQSSSNFFATVSASERRG